MEDTNVSVCIRHRGRLRTPPLIIVERCVALRQTTSVLSYCSLTPAICCFGRVRFGRQWTNAAMGILAQDVGESAEADARPWRAGCVRVCARRLHQPDR